MRRGAIALSIVGCVAAVASARQDDPPPEKADAPVVLRWSLPEGEANALRYAHVQAKVLAGTRRGQPLRQTRDRETPFRIFQRAARDEVREVELRFERVREVVAGGGQDRTRDTGTPGKDDGNWPEAKQMLEPVVFELSARGAVGRLIAFGGTSLDTQPPAVAEQVRPQIVDGLILNLALSLLGTFPEEAVAVGASWSTTTVVPVPTLGEITIAVTNTLTGIEEQGGRRLAVIRQEGEPKAEGGAMPDPEVWKIAGTIRFAVDEGQILDTDVRSVMKVTYGTDTIKSVNVIRMTRQAPEGE